MKQSELLQKATNERLLGTTPYSSACKASHYICVAIDIYVNVHYPGWFGGWKMRRQAGRLTARIMREITKMEPHSTTLVNSMFRSGMLEVGDAYTSSIVFIDKRRQWIDQLVRQLKYEGL